MDDMIKKEKQSWNEPGYSIENYDNLRLAVKQDDVKEEPMLSMSEPIIEGKSKFDKCKEGWNNMIF